MPVYVVEQTPSTGDGTCCCGGGDCPPRLEELCYATSDLDVAIDCSAGCEADCFADEPGETVPCWPDTGRLINPSCGATFDWEFTDLACNVGAMTFSCAGGTMGLGNASSACTPITIPTQTVFVQNSPLMIVMTASSHYFGFCDWDVDLGECGTEYEVTITITEP